jgi:hypothetical protein
MEALAERPSISPTVMRPAWKALEAHFKKVRKLDLRKLFGGDPARALPPSPLASILITRRITSLTRR